MIDFTLIVLICVGFFVEYVNSWWLLLDFPGVDSCVVLCLCCYVTRLVTLVFGYLLVIVGFFVGLVVYLILICWCYVCLFVMFVE